MDRFAGKIAVITGASSGIGRAVAKELTKRGLVVVGLARKIEKMQVKHDYFFFCARFPIRSYVGCKIIL